MMSWVGPVACRTIQACRLSRGTPRVASANSESVSSCSGSRMTEDQRSPQRPFRWTMRRKSIGPEVNSRCIERRACRGRRPPGRQPSTALARGTIATASPRAAWPATVAAAVPADLWGPETRVQCRPLDCPHAWEVPQGQNRSSLPLLGLFPSRRGRPLRQFEIGGSRARS